VKPAPAIAGRPFALALDLPVVTGSPVALQRLAAYASPWPGALGLWRSGDGLSFEPVGLIEVPSVIGETLTTLPPGPVWRWDRTNTLDLKLTEDVLVSVTPEAALGGANLLALRDASGLIEIIAAANVTLIGAKTYRLSMLLRGLAGSEPVASRTLAAGARVVVLDSSLFALTGDLADLNRPWQYRLGPAAADVGDISMTAFTASAGPLALLPLAPVHIRARREAMGVRISWIRQTRIGGDAWEPVDVPLGEDSEAYAVNLYSGATLKRSISAATAGVLYANADEIADFGSVQASLDISVSQMSMTAGEGMARRRLVALT
jgi:hypothetical protein